MAKVIAYVRVSTGNHQEESGSQIAAILAHANSRKLYIDQTLVSSTLEGEYRQVTSKMVKGDTLILQSVMALETDRLLGFVKEATDLTHRGITVVTVAENYVLKDDIGSLVLVSTMGLGDMIKKHQAAELEIARANTVPANEDQRT